MLFFDFLYIIFLLIFLPLGGFRFLIKKEYRRIIKHRLIPDIQAPTQSKKRIWLHAVSVGEVRSLKSLIKQLKETTVQPLMEEAEVEIVLSVSTPSGYKCAKKEYPDISVINAPLDFSFTIRSFIKKIDPQILILNELEIWPNWVTILKRKEIPILLINGRMSQMAYNRYRRFGFLLKPFFRKIDRFLIQAEIYKQRFKVLGIDDGKIRVCGNIKADEAYSAQQYLPTQNETFLHLGIRPNGKPIVTLASSHLADEQFFVPAMVSLADDFQFIIVPRHLDRVPDIEKRLESHDIKFCTWTKQKPSTGKTIPDKHVLIFDCMGYLFQVLNISHVIVMGGTMDPKTGGHNLYEPAVLGKPIIGGNYYNNFPDIGGELTEQGVYKIVSDAEQCFTQLSHFKQPNPDQMGNIAKKARESVSRRRGSIKCTLEEIQLLLSSGR